MTAGPSVDPSRSSIFWSYSRTNFQFQMVAGSSLFFPVIHMKYVVFTSLCPALLRFWFQTDFGRENSARFFKKYRRGRPLLIMSRFGTLHVQFLCSDWSKFDRWVHAENLCSILKVVYFDSWSWQSFVSTCDIFNCLFPLDVQNEIQLLSRVFSYLWMVCSLGFLVEKCIACQSR